MKGKRNFWIDNKEKKPDITIEEIHNGSVSGWRNPYLTVNNSSPAYYMAPGQAFFVYAVDGGGTVTFEEVSQTSQTGNIFKSGETGHPAINPNKKVREDFICTHRKYQPELTTGKKCQKSLLYPYRSTTS